MGVIVTTSSHQPNDGSKNDQRIKYPPPHSIRASHGISKRSKNGEGSISASNLFTSERRRKDHLRLNH